MRKKFVKNFWENSLACQRPQKRRKARCDMNNNKMKFLVVAGAMCVAGLLMAAPGAGAPPRGGQHGGPGAKLNGGQPQHQKVVAPASKAGHPAQKGEVRPGGGHVAVTPMKTRTPPPAAKPHQPTHQPAVTHHPPHHQPAVKHHSRPANARHWARPAPPPRHHGAKRAWEWVATTWDMVVGGVHYYGDGYYYDGYNYYYNGAYYTTPPVFVSQPVVVAPTPPPPVVTQPVVVTPAPPPPPPRRRGLLEWLFGD